MRPYFLMCEEPWMCLIVMSSPSIIWKGKQNDYVKVKKYLFELEACSVHSIVTCAKITFVAIAYPHPPKTLV